jgi:hypothetical protein
MGDAFDPGGTESEAAASKERDDRIMEDKNNVNAADLDLETPTMQVNGGSMLYFKEMYFRRIKWRKNLLKRNCYFVQKRIINN